MHYDQLLHKGIEARDEARDSPLQPNVLKVSICQAKGEKDQDRCDGKIRIIAY